MVIYRGRPRNVLLLPGPAEATASSGGPWWHPWQQGWGGGSRAGVADSLCPGPLDGHLPHVILRLGLTFRAQAIGQVPGSVQRGRVTAKLIHLELQSCSLSHLVPGPTHTRLGQQGAWRWGKSVVRCHCQLHGVEACTRAGVWCHPRAMRFGNSASTHSQRSPQGPWERPSSKWPRQVLPRDCLAVI